MKKTKNLLLLHLNILLFSFTGVMTKAASLEYNKNGFKSPMLYVFFGLMLLNCLVYAFLWQKIIKRFDLSVAYANRTVYLIWSQIWAVLIFHERLSVNNIIGMLVVLVGVMVVQFYG